MRYSIFIVLSLFSLNLSLAQIFEVGVFAGGSNLISDVGSTNYISPNKAAFGGIIKWNRSPRHSFRASLIYSEIEAQDSKSDDPRREERGYSYINNSFLEFSAGIEFTFWEFDLHTGLPMATPYLYTGISIAHHDNYYFSNGVQTAEGTSSFAYGIPMVVGFKASISDHFVLAAEIGARYTFSDELDGSVPDSPSLIENLSFGNVNNNDWYTFTGVTLTYTFGRNPCWCPTD